MNTIHIDRLDLKCLGIQPATAQAALRELAPILRRQLVDGGGGTDNDMARLGSATIRVSGGITATALAGAVAARVAAAVRNRIPPGEPSRKS